MDSTAAGLWHDWTSRGLVRPKDYDTDVEDAIRESLRLSGREGVGSVGQAMAEAGWSVRDLFHTLAPLISSFTGMQRDLMGLLRRIGAAEGTEESTRLVYEFVAGDPVDESLADFRERVSRLERVLALAPDLQFTEELAAGFPLWLHHSWERIDQWLQAGGTSEIGAWPFEAGVPDAPASGVAEVDHAAARVLTVAREMLRQLLELGQTTDGVRAWLSAEDRSEDPSLPLANRSTDYWPLYIASAAHAWAAAIVAGGEFDLAEVAAVEAWADGFGTAASEVTADVLIEELTDVLSLPTWGKRHELYSAWIATQLDRALAGRLRFVVADGALRFPFHATLLARLDEPSGVELWSEVRSSATGELGGGRKAGIQPDYRFVRDDGVSVAAVEVKQYKSSAATRHAVTLRDYVAALPGATVVLVAHGPVGPDADRLVPAEDRGRVAVHEDVRPGRPREAGRFRASIAALFPTRALAVTSVGLRWSRRVHDVDLLASTRGPEAAPVVRNHVLDGGPQILDVPTGLPLDIEVRVFSGGTVAAADPVVIFWSGDEELARLCPTDYHRRRGGRDWQVATIGADGRVAIGEESESVEEEH